MQNSPKSALRSPRLRTSFAFYLLQSGFQVFKKRLREELQCSQGLDLDEFADDDTLYPLYRRGESMNYVIESLTSQDTGHG